MSPLERGGTIREQRASARTHNFFPASGAEGVSLRGGSSGWEQPTPAPLQRRGRIFMLNGAAPGGMGNSCENPPRRRTRPRLVHPLREADDDNEDKQESSEIMKEHTILFPVCGTLYPYRMSHHSFWLARYLPARLCLVEVLLPTGWFR